MKSADVLTCCCDMSLEWQNQLSQLESVMFLETEVRPQLSHKTKHVVKRTARMLQKLKA